MDVMVHNFILYSLIHHLTYTEEAPP